LRICEAIDGQYIGRARAIPTQKSATRWESRALPAELRCRRELVASLPSLISFRAISDISIRGSVSVRGRCPWASWRTRRDTRLISNSGFGIISCAGSKNLLFIREGILTVGNRFAWTSFIFLFERTLTISKIDYGYKLYFAREFSPSKSYLPDCQSICSRIMAVVGFNL